MQQHQRVGDQREGGQRNCDAEIVGVDLPEFAVGEEGAADRGSADGHERHHRKQCHHGQPGGQRQVGEHGRDVVGSSVAAQSRHDDRQNGHSDDAEGQLQHQPGVVVDRRPGRGRGAGDLVADNQPDLANQHVEHHGGGHHCEPLEPRIDSPQRPQADPLGADGGQQDGGLGEHPQRRSDAEHQQLHVAHLHRVHRKLSRHHQVEAEGGDRDHIVGDRPPGWRAEHVAGVQDCHEYRRQPVEDHLWQQQIGERRRERCIDLRIGTQHETHEKRRGDHRQQGRHQEQGGCQRHQSPDEGLPAVAVFAFRARQHRNENRRERRL